MHGYRALTGSELHTASHFIIWGIVMKEEIKVADSRVFYENGKIQMEFGRESKQNGMDLEDARKLLHAHVNLLYKYGTESLPDDE